MYIYLYIHKFNLLEVVSLLTCIRNPWMPLSISILVHVIRDMYLRQAVPYEQAFRLRQFVIQKSNLIKVLGSCKNIFVIRGLRNVKLLLNVKGQKVRIKNFAFPQKSKRFRFE